MPSTESVHAQEPPQNLLNFVLSKVGSLLVPITRNESSDEVQSHRLRTIARYKLAKDAFEHLCKKVAKVENAHLHGLQVEKVFYVFGSLKVWVTDPNRGYPVIEIEFRLPVEGGGPEGSICISERTSTRSFSGRVYPLTEVGKQEVQKYAASILDERKNFIHVMK